MDELVERAGKDAAAGASSKFLLEHLPFQSLDMFFPFKPGDVLVCIDIIFAIASSFGFKQLCRKASFCFPRSAKCEVWAFMNVSALYGKSRSRTLS